MSQKEQELLSLIGLLYDAALKDERWPAFLEALARAMAADSAFARLGGSRAGEAAFIAQFGYDEAYIRAYREYYYQLDPYRAPLLEMPIGEVVEPALALPDAERFKTEYHNDYERPQDKVHVAAAYVARDNGRELLVSMQRGRRAPVFSGEEKRLLQILLPHLQRAFQIRRQFLTLQAERSAAREALDRLPVSLFLVDPEARLVLINARGEELLRKGQGLRLCAGVIRTSKTGETAALHQLIADAARAAAGKGTSSGGTLRISSGPTHQLNVVVAPLPADRLALGSEVPAASAALFVTSSQQRVVLPLERLVTLYGLTRAEARLAAGLARGASLEELAELFAITKNTARTHLRSVLQKTDTRRQGELVAKLLAGPLAACSTELTSPEESH